MTKFQLRHFLHLRQGGFLRQLDMGRIFKSPRRLRAKYSLCTNLRFMTKSFSPSGGSLCEGEKICRDILSSG